MKTGHSFKLFDIITSLHTIESFQNFKDRITPKTYLKNAVRKKKCSPKNIKSFSPRELCDDCF
jgi:hypothetical protein